MKKNSNTHKPQNKHLVAAAKLLLEKIDRPSTLLQFLTNALYHYHEFSIEHSNIKDKLELINEYNGIQTVVEELVIPWMNGGNDVLYNIAHGVYKLYDYGGYECYYNTLGNILLAHSYSFKAGIPDEESQQSDLSIINTLAELGNHIRKYEEEKGEKEAA